MKTLIPTPETDAHQIDMNRVEFDEELALTYNLSRKLERERDAARQQLIAEHTPFTTDQWAGLWQQEVDARNILFKENIAMREEIREAIKSLEDWHLLWKELCPLASTKTFLDGRAVQRASAKTRAKLQSLIN